MKLVRVDSQSSIQAQQAIGDEHLAVYEDRQIPLTNMAVKRAVQIERLHPLLQREGDEETANVSPWAGQHLPYTIAGTLLAAVALAAVLVSSLNCAGRSAPRSLAEIAVLMAKSQACNEDVQSMNVPHDCTFEWYCIQCVRS